ncbi:hypothetical protein HID58_024133 [Brassica napus]|uniref:Uncharacterized protein n=1 Tax=Brassica napus TaxID=3708 RepID=A0ABQ8D6I9_BRANA|nr:hypothetical protein HID58_024133 [Brassica napus]
MFASRIVEFLEDLVEEIDVRCLSDVRGDLPLPDTDQRDRMVLVGDRWWYFSLSLAFRFGLIERRRRRHETASQSSGPGFVFANLESFGRRRRAHKGWRFPVLRLHQIWFHLSAPRWKGMNTPARDTSESDKARRCSLEEGTRFPCLLTFNFSLRFA